MSSEISIRPPDNVPLFSARLKPHRSLSPQGVRLVITVFAALSLLWCLPLVFLGVWPVAGSLGAAVLILSLAFRANSRAAEAYEDLELTFFELHLAKVSARGEKAEFSFNPSFVRLEQERHEEFGIQRLALVSSGRAVEFAAFLGPQAKADLAVRLSRALSEARRGPRFS